MCKGRNGSKWENLDVCILEQFINDGVLHCQEGEDEAVLQSGVPENVRTLKMATTMGALRTRRTGAETPVTSTTYHRWMGTGGETERARAEKEAGSRIQRCALRTSINVMEFFIAREKKMSLAVHQRSLKAVRANMDIMATCVTRITSNQLVDTVGEMV